MPLIQDLSGISRLRDPSLFIQSALIGADRLPIGRGPGIDVFNPASGALVGRVPDCGTNETSRAVEAAAEAFPAWRNLPAGERGQILERWWSLILQNAGDLAAILTAEQGKPLAEADGEVRYAASFVKWFAEEGRRVSGYDVPAPTADRRILVLKEPIGVAAAITPWNFPAAMVTRKAAAALAAGCSMVIKPSELTPFTALALAELALRAGAPPGVLNVVVGQAEPIGAELSTNPAVRKLSFTGSTRVGALLMRRCAESVKKLSLELGGNAAFLVFDDADIELAVEGVMASKFRNAGQTCVCANRILVQAGIHDRFVERLARAVKALKVGDGAAEGVTIGPLINPEAVTKVRAHLENALSLGGKLVATAAHELDPARFVSPALITQATEEMRVAHEETFGPLAPVFRFQREEEAIRMANDTPYGLAGYFYTRDLYRAWRVAARLECGMVGLNTGAISVETAPFGGVKLSGFGREGGREGIEEYLTTKTFHWGALELDPSHERTSDPACRPVAP